MDIWMVLLLVVAATLVLVAVAAVVVLVKKELKLPSGVTVMKTKSAYSKI